MLEDGTGREDVVWRRGEREEMMVGSMLDTACQEENGDRQGGAEGERQDREGREVV